MDPSDISQSFADHGVAITVLIFVGWCIVYVLRRLFNKDDGIVTLAARSHVSLVASLEKSTKKLSATTADAAEQLTAQTDILKAVVKLKDDMDPASLRRAGLIACEIIDELITHAILPESVQPLEVQMRAVLSHNGLPPMQGE